MHRPTVMQNEIDKVISSVIDTARTKQLTNYKDQYSREDDDSAAAKSYMSLLSTNFTSCLNEATIESVDESLEDYLNNLLRNYYNVYLKCARDLRSILIQND